MLYLIRNLPHILEVRSPAMAQAFNISQIV